MEDVLSLIRTLLEDMEDPEEIVRPEAVQAEQEVADRATAEPPRYEPPVPDMRSAAVEKPAAADVAPAGRLEIKLPNWVFPDKSEAPSPSPVKTEALDVRNTEIVDPLRFAAGVVTATERQQQYSGELDPRTNARVAVQTVNQSVRVETVIPDSFPLDAREIFSRVDQELHIPVLPGGDPRYADAVSLPEPSVGDSSEQAIAKHYASVQGVLELDQRNTLE